MTSLCTTAVDLVRELERSEWLPFYNDEGVRKVFDEVTVLHNQILEKLRVFGDDIEQHPSVHCGLVVTHQCLLRNKRCLLAYLMARVNKIKALRWELGAVVPDGLRKSLSQAEIQFFHAYDQQLSDYMADLDLDVTTDLAPPKNLYIEVRVLHDCGELMTESGVINLQANSTHFLRRFDAEPLIRQGLLQHLER
uniref:DNA replication complex GINS protein PSF1 putative n=1 Tax=Albugo laibachii Nc14 TaxID=890382 RepID=F0WW43_9STRA|nr:DNA replication complex GINS protein PSF1 putative [Albugo laibachii Nc14]|eukprot:CCA25651.1 DNA replication complex GINS protein PSF1 putative [Albugo laibachii Nc14]